MRAIFLIFLFCMAGASAFAVEPLPRGTPESAGMSSERLARVAAAIQSDIDAGRMAGAVIAIARNGRLVYHEAFGWQDKAANVRMQKDSMFAVASMTKPLTAVGAMILQEENLLSLNEPVGKYLPVLDKWAVIDGVAGEAKAPFRTVPPVRKPTIQDLMRHTAGLSYGNRGQGDLFKAWPASGIATAEEVTGAEFLERIGSLPLFYQPGTTWDYSLSFEVLGLAMEAVAKQPLEEVLGARLFRPLGMKDTTFVLPPEKFARLARPLVNPATGKPPATFDATRGVKFQCGGGCLVTTAGDYVRFQQMLLDQGRAGKQRVVSRKSLEFMTANQLNDKVDVSRLDAYANLEGYGFGLGVAVRTAPGIAGVMGSPGEFHWHGATGSLAWVDPKEKLAVVFLAVTPGPGLRFQNRRVINALVYQALE